MQTKTGFVKRARAHFGGNRMIKEKEKYGINCDKACIGIGASSTRQRADTKTTHVACVNIHSHQPTNTKLYTKQAT